MSPNDPNLQPPEPTFGPPEVVPPPAPPAIVAFPHRPLAIPSWPHPNFWWAILWCVGLLLFTQIPGALAAAAILVVGLIVRGGAAEAPQDLLNDPIMGVALGAGILVAHGLIILFSLVCLRLIAGRDWHRQVALRLPGLTHVALVVAVAPAFILLGSAAYEALKYAGVPTMADLMKEWLPGPSGGTNTGFDMEEMEKLFGSWPLVLAVFCIGVMPGLSEELWCRAFIGRGVVGRHGYVLGILGTSLLFGAIHVDPRQGTMAVLMGIMLHYVYQVTRSLLAPMLLHFLNNSLAVTLPRVEVLQPLASDQVGSPADRVILYAAAALLFCAVCLALYRSRARLVTPPGAMEWRPSWPGVACPPPESPTRVVTPSPGFASVALVLTGVAAMAYSLVKLAAG